MQLGRDTAHSAPARQALALGCRDDLLRGFFHAFGRNDGQARVSQHLAADLFIGTLHPLGAGAAAT